MYTVSGERVANVRQPEDLMRLKSQLPSGVYIVSMQIDGKTVNQKMVIHQ
ncbi:T9SS type A sorting domain-containing protein [Prevotella corporis]|nr:T9SS type A sorting domain-containing protein [Prevotella corporis]